MFSQLVVVVLFGLFGTSSGAAVAVAVTAVTTAVGVINEVTALITGVDGTWGMFGSADDSGEKFQEDVLKKLDNIHQACAKIDVISKQITALSFAIAESTKKIISSIEFNRAKEIVADCKKDIDFINHIYNNKFESIVKKVKNFKPGPLRGCPHALVSDCSFDKALSGLYSDISSSLESQSNIFSAISKYYEKLNGFQYQCENITPMDDIHFFLSKVIVALTRGHAQLLISQDYLVLTAGAHDADYYRERKNNTLNDFRTRIEGLVRHAKIVLNSLHTNLRGSHACDPSEWEEGKNFIRVKNYITFQMSDNDWIKNYPSAEELAQSKEVDCRDGYAAYKGAPGTDVGASSFVCDIPFNPNADNSGMRYQEMRSPKDRIWESRTCVRAGNNYFYNNCAFDVKSDPFLSIRKLSLRPATCNAVNREVVTDARFHEQDNKIHVRVRCGVFKDGRVLPRTLRWTEDYKPLSADEYVVLGSKVKSFLIDNLSVAPDELLTGVRFKVIDGRYIGLGVRGHKVINYSSGTTFGEGKEYVAALEKPRKNINITNLERLPKKADQTYEMSEPGEDYVTLTLSKHSNYHNNRAVVPYFDMTPYNPELSVVALSGLGLMYKSIENHAGLLAFKHLSLVHVNFSMPPEAEE